ncbi:THAP domain-containing protein 2-like [Festucalex cinctus]
MPQCVAYNCANKSGKGYGCTFHRFPKDEKMCNEWVQALRRKNFRAKPGVTLICSDHFLDADFDRSGQTTRLKQGVIPSLFKFPARFQKKLSERKPPANTHATPEPDVTAALMSQIKASNLIISLDHNYCLDISPQKVKRKLNIAMDTILSLKKKLKVTNQRTRRLRTKVKSLTTLLKDMNSKGMVSDDCAKILATAFLESFALTLSE